jgi:hypothetical protein
MLTRIVLYEKGGARKQVSFFENKIHGLAYHIKALPVAKFFVRETGFLRKILSSYLSMGKLRLSDIMSLSIKGLRARMEMKISEGRCYEK